MLEEEFKTWPEDPISDVTLFTLSMHVINLSYLKDGPLYFTELPDSGTKESNRTFGRLNNTTFIPDNNNKHPPDIPDLQIE